jgi:hypothetical protein
VRHVVDREIAPVASLPDALARMRAAVRWATLMPSPMNRITFLAFGVPPVL